jgi:subfamily B ATP-binding cassette protein MsbA
MKKQTMLTCMASEERLPGASPGIVSFSWKRPLPYLKPYRGRLVLSIVALLAAAGLGLVFPLVITRLLDATGSHRGSHIFYRFGLLLAAVFVTQAALSFVQTYLFAAVGERIVFDLRSSLYEKMQSLPLEFFASRRTGELVSRLTNDVGQMRSMLASGFASSLTQIATLLGALTIIILINLRFTLFILAVVVGIVIVASFFGRIIQGASTGVQDDLAKSTVVAEEALQGIRVVKAFGRERYEVVRFAAAARATLRASLEQALYQSLMTAFMLLMGFGSIGAIMFYGVHEVAIGKLSLGVLTAFLMYGMMIAGSLSGLSNLYGQLRTVAGGVRRVFEILDLKPSMTDAPEAVTLPKLRGHITLENVSFSYEDNVPVLDGITLDIHPGEVVALIGPSGAGKTTLLNLIPRFYDPTSGSILVDGFDLREITQSSLRSQIAIVPQETILFGGTVRDNILYGRPEATEYEILQAAKAANADEFIMRLPDRYESKVGERGSRLSGGERQRISIARAILREPRILLLDEPTNALDSQAESLVQAALDRVLQGRTAIIIAHRLSTIRAAHRIAVLDRGRIVELGSHIELMKLNGLYARSHFMQYSDALQ